MCKQRDVERLGKELEGSRHYAAQIEMRYKYGSCRLRREAEDRMVVCCGRNERSRDNDGAIPVTKLIPLLPFPRNLRRKC